MVLSLLFRVEGEPGRPTIWHYWRAESEATAKKLEAYFKAQGMKGYTGKAEKMPTTSILPGN